MMIVSCFLIAPSLFSFASGRADWLAFVLHLLILMIVLAALAYISQSARQLILTLTLRYATHYAAVQRQPPLRCHIDIATLIIEAIRHCHY